MLKLRDVLSRLAPTAFALTFLFFAVPAQAAFIGLAWDPNPEPDIAGYILFYGTTSGTYGTSVDVGNTTTWNGSSLTDGQQYFFAVLAYNSSGAQSALSAELSVKPYAAAVMNSPLPGSALNTASVQFQWSAGSGVSQYRLSVGTALGGVTLFDQTSTATTAAVSGIPASGALYVRLWSLIGTTWNFKDYTYTAARPVLSIADVSVSEGSSGTQTANFIVKLTPTASSVVTVAYATANGTATAGTDYVAASGTLTFASGASTATVSVLVSGDTAVEPDETFFVNLSNASTNASIGTPKATGTIRNDDVVPPTLPMVAAVTPIAGTTGVVGSSNVTGRFSVGMNSATITTATVTLMPSGGTNPIAATVTYDAASKTVTIDPSATLAERTVYTARIKGGPAGALDLAGNPLAADKVWTFTTGKREKGGNR